MRVLASLAFLASIIGLIDAKVAIKFDTYHSTISVDDKVWLQSGDVWFNARNTLYSTANQSLNLTGTITGPGIDSLGKYVATTHQWSSVPSGLSWETSYRVYSDADQSVSQIVFSQLWVEGDDATSVGSPDTVLSSFPTFLPTKSERSLGAQQWSEIFDTSQAFIWSGDNAKLDLARGRACGPLILFDKDTPSLVSVFSTYSEFMATSFTAMSGQLAAGVVGSMKSVPAGYQSETILAFDSHGIIQGMLRWGDLLLGRYGKNRQDAYKQPTTQYLGYNTDNGAYYYYNTEPGMNYEQTLEAVVDYAKSANIPYHGMLLDSWWYPKDENLAVTTWTAMPSIFPSGLPAFSAQVKMPFIAHNRWWSPQSPYAVQNGGSYDWWIVGNYSLPTEQRFWDDLIANNTMWGLRVYEQDWLNVVWDDFKAIQTDIAIGKNWLHQMGSGAARSGVDVQYCMPYPRHLMQSVEIPNVVQIRGSGDNTPGNVDNTKLGEINLLSYALGVASFKDGFWTVNEEEGNPWNKTEPSPALHAVVATLSCGPVYPADKIGLTNVTLLSRSHRADGLILKPDRPAFSLESTYYQRAFKTNGPDAKQVTVTQSRHAQWNWHVLLVLEESHAYTLTVADLGISSSSTESYIAYSWQGGQLNGEFIAFDAKNPLPLAANPKESDFTVWYLAPVITPKFALLGETSKWVPMSKQRVNDFQIYQTEITLSLIGDTNEKVTIEWAQLINESTNPSMYETVDAQTWVVSSGSCILNNAGSATITIALNDVNSFSCHQ